MVREVAYDRAVIAACKHGHHALIEPLLTVGADVNTCSMACHTCSSDYYTGRSDHWHSNAYCYRDTPNYNDRAGDSPLITAVRYGHIACVEALIRLGADVNQTGDQSHTAFMEAVHHVLNISERPEKSNTPYYKYRFPRKLRDNASFTSRVDVLTEGAPSTTRENIVRILIKAGAAVNKKDCTGETAQVKALHCGHLKLAKFLVESGASVNINKEALANILRKAAIRGNTEIIKFIVQLRISAKTIHLYSCQALMEAASQGNMEIVRLLVHAGANVNASNSKSVTPLIEALCRHHLGVAEFLIASGADVNKGQLALCLQVLRGAAARGNVDIIKFIVRAGFKFEDVPGDASEALSEAASGGHVEIARILVEAGVNVNGKDCCGQRPLIKALARGNVQLAKFLIESGADINLVHKKTFETVLSEAVVKGNLGIVRFIAQSGVRVAIMRQYGSSALQIAVSQSLLEIVELLLGAGADVNGVFAESKTSLTISSSRGHVKVVKFLVEKGANVNFVPGHNQMSPLQYASCNGHIRTVKFLIKAGANVNFIRNKDHSTPLLVAASNDHTSIVQVLIESGAKVDAINNENQTALMKVASYGHVKSAEVLIAAGADVNHSLEDGWSVLMSAAANGHLDCLQYLLQAHDARYFSHYPLQDSIGSHNDREDFPWNKYQIAQFHCPRKNITPTSLTGSCSECVKLLVKSGADVNQATTNGWRALHFASLEGRTDIVKFLLNSGANVNTMSSINWTPLIAAVVGNHYHCVGMLIRAGADVNAMVQVWHSANWEAKTALNFAVDLNSVDVAQLLLHYGVQVDSLSMSNCSNAELQRLLRVAGDSSYQRIEDRTHLRSHIPRYLSNQCRRVIRRHLLEVNLDASLFHTVRYLGLPVLLEKYLVFNVTLKCPGILRGQSQGLCEQMLVFYKTI